MIDEGDKFAGIAGCSIAAVSISYTLVVVGSMLVTFFFDPEESDWLLAVDTQAEKASIKHPVSRCFDIGSFFKGVTSMIIV